MAATRVVDEVDVPGVNREDREIHLCVWLPV
jgi:hypothetical protein